jgi:hypothetical protein
MTAATMCMSEAGVSIGLMATGNEFISLRRLSMHRLSRRASVSFFHPSLFIHKEIALHRLPGLQTESIRAVASNAVCYE